MTTVGLGTRQFIIYISRVTKTRLPAELLGTGSPTGSFAADALSALQNLGFKPHEASTAVASAEAELGDDASLDALVRLALRKAAK